MGYSTSCWTAHTSPRQLQPLTVHTASKCSKCLMGTPTLHLSWLFLVLHGQREHSAPLLQLLIGLKNIIRKSYNTATYNTATPVLSLSITFLGLLSLLLSKVGSLFCLHLHRCAGPRLSPGAAWIAAEHGGRVSQSPAQSVALLARYLSKHSLFCQRPS